ncbi:MAG: ribonuclease H-like domain-containing protein [Nitrospirae bacterium]|jgi:uncharacterized protein|nr:ribonuclease H-like domain-containing protein [Nitrospirota bacterium]
MIKNTLSILNGIGEKLEKKLWGSGIISWNDFIDSPDLKFISPCKKRMFDDFLISALQELDRSNSVYFSTNLKRREHWRLYNTFKPEAVCLDIETNGLMPDNGGYVTLIGIYDGFDYRCLVHGANLTPENLNSEISGYKYLITFYGAIFDIPFLKRSMPEIKFDIPHFDICFGSKRLGFKGGLKKLEAELGIKRHEAVSGMDGYDAVKLWEHAKRGSKEALELLKIYNMEDTVNLFKIAEIIYNGLRLQTGIDEYLQCKNH